MKNKLLKKLIGMTAAASLGCTAVISSGAFFMSSSAAEAKVPAAENVVNVIVKLKGGTVLDDPAVSTMGADFIKTPGAAAIASDLRASQKAVQDSIRAIYPEVEVRNSFVITMNGFSCSLPKGSIPAVEALPGVEYVYEDQVKSVPEMITAPEFASVPTFCQETGCTGEGIVITVIDSEFDVTHPMFQELAPGVNTSITKEDVRYIAENIGFNVDISADKAYLNSKVPYCASYAGDPYLDVPDDRLGPYHGTHVSGIAAGNEFSPGDGFTYSGVAKDAQIIFMAIHDPKYNDGSVSFDVTVGAIEDSIKLGTDIISMSFGVNAEYYDTDPLNDAFAAADKAGIILLKSAGNEGNGSNTSVLRPDDGTVANCYSDSIFIVGSAENDPTYGQERCVISLNGMEFENFGGNAVDTGKNYSISDELSGEYSYECFDFGKPEEFEGVDLTGKIAVINRGELMFGEKYANAVAAGAVGVIIINTPDADNQLLYTNEKCNMALVSYLDGQRLINAEKKVINISTETDETLDTDISWFSSWGPTVTLDIRPDIVGIGGNVTSAAYGASIKTMSGTSMSTPYTSGCTAILLQYLKENGMKEKTPERAAYVRKLLMNSAELMTRDDAYISPREQGAGLVSLTNALNEKVLLTGSEGKAKVNLYDGIENSFSFTVDAENISGEDVSFKSAKLVLATDGYELDPDSAQYYVSGQIELENNADLSELLSIKAWEKKSLTVDCVLDKAQLDEIGKVYENGFYIYGFIVLEGAENCCDTSIPVLGFRGDWTKGEILDISSAIPYTVFGERTVPRMRSFMEEVMLWAELREKLPELIPEGFELTSENYFDVLQAVLEPEDFARLTALAEQSYVSGNGDGINDVAALSLNFDRFAEVKADFTDDKGDVLEEIYDSAIAPKSTPFFLDMALDDSFAEGSYSFDLTSCTKFAPDKKEKDSYGFIVDNTAPELDVRVEETKDGKRIMTVTASDDNALDGVMIIGSGKGRLVGADEDVKYNYLDAADDMLSLFDDDQSDIYYDYSSENRTFFDDLLAGWIAPETAEEITFSDIILPGEDGKVSFEYDITDLEVFAVTALDKAFNTAEEYVDSVSAETETITPGIWADEDGFYQFNEDGSVDIRMYDQPEGVEFSGEYKDGVLKVSMNGEEASSAKSTLIYDDSAVFQDAEDPDDVNVLYFITSDKKLDEIGFYSPLQLIQGIIENQVRTQGVCWPYNDTTYCGGTKFEIKSYTSYDPESDNNTPSHIYFADILTGIVTDSNGKAINVMDKTISDFTYFQKGVWVGNADNDVMYFFFDSTNQTGYIKYASDGSLDGFDYVANEDNTLTIYTGNDVFTLRTEYRVDITTMEEYLDVYSEDGSVQTLTFNRELRPLRFEYCNYRELSAMAVKDYAAKHDGSEPSEANFRANDDNTVDIELSKNGKVVETYTIDPVTAQGTDSEGNDVELPQTGNNSPMTAAETACAFLLMIGGVFALVKSGMFRRKDEE